MTDHREQKERAKGLLAALNDPHDDDEHVHPGFMALCTAAPDLAAAVISLAGEVERLERALALWTEFSRSAPTMYETTLRHEISRMHFRVAAALSPLPSERKGP